MSVFVASKVLRVFTEVRAPQKDYGLAAREQEILQLLVDERTQKEVAAKLHVSPHTVDTHLQDIYDELQVR